MCLVLVAIGVFSTLSYLVRQRRRELAVSIALGSRRRALLASVLARQMMPIACRLALGVGLAAFILRHFTAILVSLAPWAPLPYLGAPGVLAGVSVTACLIPARRPSSRANRGPFSTDASLLGSSQGRVRQGRDWPVGELAAQDQFFRRARRYTGFADDIEQGLQFLIFPGDRGGRVQGGPRGIG